MTRRKASSFVQEISIQQRSLRHSCLCEDVPKTGSWSLLLLLTLLFQMSSKQVQTPAGGGRGPQACLAFFSATCKALESKGKGSSMQRDQAAAVKLWHHLAPPCPLLQFLSSKCGPVQPVPCLGLFFFFTQAPCFFHLPTSTLL